MKTTSTLSLYCRLTNYSSVDIEKIMGLKTSQIEKALGYRYSDEVIHADNIVIGSK